MDNSKTNSKIPFFNIECVDYYSPKELSRILKKYHRRHQTNSVPNTPNDDNCNKNLDLREVSKKREKKRRKKHRYKFDNVLFDIEKNERKIKSSPGLNYEDFQYFTSLWKKINANEDFNKGKYKKRHRSMKRRNSLLSLSKNLSEDYKINDVNILQQLEDKEKSPFKHKRKDNEAGNKKHHIKINETPRKDNDEQVENLSKDKNKEYNKYIRKYLKNLIKTEKNNKESEHNENCEKIFRQCLGKNRKKHKIKEEILTTEITPFLIPASEEPQKEVEIKAPLPKPRRSLSRSLSKPSLKIIPKPKPRLSLTKAKTFKLVTNITSDIKSCADEIHSYDVGTSTLLDWSFESSTHKEKSIFQIKKSITEVQNDQMVGDGDLSKNKCKSSAYLGRPSKKSLHVSTSLIKTKSTPEVRSKNDVSNETRKKESNNALPKEIFTYFIDEFIKDKVSKYLTELERKQSLKTVECQTTEIDLSYQEIKDTFSDLLINYSEHTKPFRTTQAFQIDEASVSPANEIKILWKNGVWTANQNNVFRFDNQKIPLKESPSHNREIIKIKSSKSIETYYRNPIVDETTITDESGESSKFSDQTLYESGGCDLNPMGVTNIYNYMSCGPSAAEVKGDLRCVPIFHRNNNEVEGPSGSFCNHPDLLISQAKILFERKMQATPSSSEEENWKPETQKDVLWKKHDDDKDYKRFDDGTESDVTNVEHRRMNSRSSDVSTNTTKRKFYFQDGMSDDTISTNSAEYAKPQSPAGPTNSCTNPIGNIPRSWKNELYKTSSDGHSVSTNDIKRCPNNSKEDSLHLTTLSDLERKYNFMEKSIVENLSAMKKNEANQSIWEKINEMQKFNDGSKPSVIDSYLNDDLMSPHGVKEESPRENQEISILFLKPPQLNVASGGKAPPSASNYLEPPLLHGRSDEKLTNQLSTINEIQTPIAQSESNSTHILAISASLRDQRWYHQAPNENKTCAPHIEEQKQKTLEDNLVVRQIHIERSDDQNLTEDPEKSLTCSQKCLDWNRKCFNEKASKSLKPSSKLAQIHLGSERHTTLFLTKNFSVSPERNAFEKRKQYDQKVKQEFRLKCRNDDSPQQVSYFNVHSPRIDRNFLEDVLKANYDGATREQEKRDRNKKRKYFNYVKKYSKLHRRNVKNDSKRLKRDNFKKDPSDKCLMDHSTLDSGYATKGEEKSSNNSQKRSRIPRYQLLQKYSWLNVPKSSESKRDQTEAYKEEMAETINPTWPGGFFNYQKFLADSRNEEETTSQSTASSNKRSLIELFTLKSFGDEPSNCSIVSSNTTVHQLMSMECQKFAKKVKEYDSSMEEVVEFREIPLETLLSKKCIPRKDASSTKQVSPSTISLQFYPDEKISVADFTKISTNASHQTFIPEDLTNLTEKQFFDYLLTLYDKQSDIVQKLAIDEEFFIILIENIRNDDKYQSKKTAHTFWGKKRKRGLFNWLFGRKFQMDDEKKIEIIYKKSDNNSNESVDSPIEKTEFSSNEHIKRLAARAKHHLEPMVRATITNSHINDKIKLAGFLKLLETIENGDSTMFDVFEEPIWKIWHQNDSKTLMEDFLKKHISKIFCDVYKIADREAKQRNGILDVGKIHLLKILATRYYMGMDAHIRILAIYIGKGKIQRKYQLEDAILYLMGATQTNLDDFERSCGLNELSIKNLN